MHPRERKATLKMSFKIPLRFLLRQYYGMSKSRLGACICVLRLHLEALLNSRDQRRNRKGNDADTLEDKHFKSRGGHPISTLMGEEKMTVSPLSAYCCFNTDS